MHFPGKSSEESGDKIPDLKDSFSGLVYYQPRILWLNRAIGELANTFLEDRNLLG